MKFTTGRKTVRRDLKRTPLPKIQAKKGEIQRDLAEEKIIEYYTQESEDAEQNEELHLWQP